jgi:diaminopimelate epimerase
MKIRFSKYHALGNDFLLLEKRKCRLSRSKLPRFAREVCNRRTGVGADGIIVMSADRIADATIDIYNADGGWAEKSGNGLRIAAVHMARSFPRKKTFTFRTGNGIDKVRLRRRISDGSVTTTQLGKPEFVAAEVPVRTKRKHLINSPLRIGPVVFPVTCLSVGNPHTVLLVKDFDFDWKQLGSEIENAPVFPNGTNVEFVKIMNRKKIKVADWERGAGATASSGTGAAAAVCAMVMLGLVDRRCNVEFETGMLAVDWNADTNIVELTGPAKFVMEGGFEFR